MVSDGSNGSTVYWMWKVSCLLSDDDGFGCPVFMSAKPWLAYWRFDQVHVSNRNSGLEFILVEFRGVERLSSLTEFMPAIVP